MQSKNMQSKTKQLWDITVGIVGLLITITGWFIDHADHISWVQGLLSPAYSRATKAYDNLVSSHQPLRAGQVGFSELASIVRERLLGTGELDIVELSIPEDGWSVLSTDKGMESTPTITLQVTLKDGRSAERSGIKDLRPIIRERFLENRLFAFGAGVFWLGIFITGASIVALVWEIRRDSSYHSFH